MTTNETFAEHIRTLKNMERRLRQIERKLIETDDKLDHIMFRLMEEDPRVYHGNGSCQSRSNSNSINGSC